MLRLRMMPLTSSVYEEMEPLTGSFHPSRGRSSAVVTMACDRVVICLKRLVNNHVERRRKHRECQLDRYLVKVSIVGLCVLSGRVMGKEEARSTKCKREGFPLSCFRLRLP